MTLVVVLLVVLILIKAKFFGKGFNENFMGKDQTNALNGIFIFIVLVSHMRGYLHVENSWPMVQMCSTLGQMMVTSFLFISGYGCAVSYQKKGEKYVNAFPRNRILTVLVNFDIAILIYLIFNFILGKTFTIGEIIPALIGWTSIGNSNWYIFAILCLYLGFYICFKLFGKNESHFFLFLSMFVFTAIYIYTVSYFKAKSYWYYDTVLCFPMGVLFAYYKDRVYECITKSNARYLSLLVLFGSAFIYMNKVGGFQFTPMYMNIYAVIFIFFIILILMKVQIGNKVLGFFGTHVFEIYIYQRIPMILLQKFTPLAGDTKYYYIYFILVLLGTLLITVVMHFIYGKVDRLLKAKS